MRRSASVEAIEQFTRALAQIATLPSTPWLRRQEIKFQGALITALVHIKGWGAPEVKAASERTRFLIGQAEARGESPEDSQLLFLVFAFGLSFVAFNGDVTPGLAAQFLELAEKKRAVAYCVLGHNFLGGALMVAGDITEARAHLDQAIAHYDPAEHRPLAIRWGENALVNGCYFRSKSIWLLGYPKTARADCDQALKEAGEIDHATSLLWALGGAFFIDIFCGDYAIANTRIDECIALANEKGAKQIAAGGMLARAWLFAVTGKTSDAVQMLTSGIAAWRSTGSTVFMPWFLSLLARAYAGLSQFEDAWRCIDEAMTAVETTKEKWCEAEVHRVAGEIALLSQEPDTARAEANLERALAVSRKQKAKSWELRAAMSVARLWRDQGKPDEARELLAPVYGWFTEGFDTLDLKEAKALLGELAS
jgi:predicted ATPase